MQRRPIQQDFIRQLKRQTDIVDIVGRTVDLKKSGNGYKGLCPFHDEKTPSFSVNPRDNYFHCFGCETSGDALTFLMKQASLDFYDAVHQLADYTGVEVVYEEKEGWNPADSAKTEHCFAVLRKAYDYYQKQLQSSQGKRALLYLTKRGIDKRLITEYGLGYAPAQGDGLLQQLETSAEREAALTIGLIRSREKGGGGRGDIKDAYDFFRDRILFPIVDARERPLGFGGRIIGVGEPKYINSTDSLVFQKGREFYGAPQALGPQALGKKGDSLVVVEGYMDVLGLAETTRSVACLGTALSRAHAQRLLSWTDDLSFAFDGDAAGGKAAERALEQCLPLLTDKMSRKKISFVFLPQGEDPHSILHSQGTTAWEKLPRIPMEHFVLRELMSDTTIEERKRRVKRTAEILAHLPAGNLQRLLRRKAEEMTGIRIEIPTLMRGDYERFATTEGQEAEESLVPRASVTRSVERCMLLLLAKPELSMELDEEWRELLRDKKEMGGDIGLMVRLLTAAEQGRNYLYGYIRACGRQPDMEAVVEEPSVRSLQKCLFDVLGAQARKEIGEGIKEENREKTDQAKRLSARLAAIWRTAQEQPQPLRGETT